LKIYINKKPITGPWGGGNKFVTELSIYLKKIGYDVTFNLLPDVDLIFCFDPRPNSEGLWYNDFLNHKIKYNSKIIQRVGDVGTHSKPDLTNLVIESSKFSDFLIFPSNWAKNYINYKKQNYAIIFNCPMKIFYKNRKKNFKLEEKLKIVTHHWSTNEKKGFDFYSYLGKMIMKNKIEDVEFTYIGRYNNNFETNGIEIISPKSSDDLASILPNYDIYLTASIEEAGANHVLEAIACGLPILYRKNGGSISEYCKKFGIEYFDKLSMLESITSFKKNHLQYYNNTRNYKDSINDVVKRYEEIICKV